MSSPPSAPPTTSEAYSQLTAILHPLTATEPSVLEIDILPSTYPPQILYEHPALALPKSLLVKVYLQARSVFFSSHSISENIDENSDNRIRNETFQTARLSATPILLLFDPSHLTAINFRKQHILSLRSTAPETLPDTLNREISLLTSLLTSPLSKHAKSSSLWSHRLWLFRHHHDHFIALYTSTSSSATGDAAATIWDSELEIVLKAAVRHPRNYYLWEYARQVFRLLYATCNSSSEMIATMRKVHSWCLLHPRDISGWAFLLFVIQSVQRSRCVVDSVRREIDEVGDRHGEGTEESVEQGKEAVKVIERVVWETEDWVRKYEWRGESVEWFLKWVKESLGRECGSKVAGI